MLAKCLNNRFFFKLSIICRHTSLSFCHSQVSVMWLNKQTNIPLKSAIAHTQFCRAGEICAFS